MRICPDTSFIVSWLYTPDVNHAKASSWFAAHQADDWLISPWAEFETVNTLRGFCRQTPGPSAALVEALRRYFKHLFRTGTLEREALEWQELLKDAHQVSAALATRHKARAADVLHIATLEQINPDVFVTFDHDQAVMATQRGFNVVEIR